MTASRRLSAPKAEKQHGIHEVYETLGALYAEVFQSPLESRVLDTLRKWVAKSDWVGSGLEADRRSAAAMLLAMDLDIFTPSMTGTTNLDRLSRRRKLSHDEIAALSVLQRARFTPLRILSVQDNCFFAAENLVTGEKRTIFDGAVRGVATGATVVTRICVLPDGTFATVGPVVPIDEAGLAIVRDFIKPGKGITNDYRCAAAVYRHVARHGASAVPGFNLPSDEPASDAFDDSAAPRIGPLEAIAKAWAALGEGREPPDESVDAVRSLASPDLVVEMLFKTVTTRVTKQLDKASAAKFASIYQRFAELMIETLHRRAAVGSGHDRAPLDTIAKAIAHEIAHNGYPREAAALFEALRKTIAAQAKPKQNADDLTKILERIRALRAKTIDQGCTESEAMAAAKKVAELLDRYGLSVSEIDIKGQTCEGFGIDSTRKRSGPLDNCLNAIARFCDCRAWQERSAAGTIRSVFFGLPADVEAAHYLYERVTAAFETETKAFQTGDLYTAMEGGNRRTATNSFQIGLSRGVNFKLNSLRDEREAAFKTQSGRDLVLLKTSTIEEDLAKLGMSFRVKAKNNARRIFRHAFEAGEVAGRQFDARGTLAD